MSEETKKEPTKSPNLVIGFILLIIIAFVVVGLVMIYSRADTVTVETDVDNASPVVSKIFLSSAAYGAKNDFTAGIPLLAGGEKDVYVNGSVVDENGVADIKSVDLKMYRSGVGKACSKDKNTCYEVASCETKSVDKNTLDYNCPVSLSYFADATDVSSDYSADTWSAAITVSDNSGANASSTVEADVRTLLALNIPTSISYGTLTNGQSTTSSNNQVYTLTQQGNDAASVTVKGTDMACSVTGTIPVGNQQWSTSDVSYADANATALTTTAVDTGIEIAPQTDDLTTVTTNLYWNLAIPDDVVGTCTGTNTVSAVATTGE